MARNNRTSSTPSGSDQRGASAALPLEGRAVGDGAQSAADSAAEPVPSSVTTTSEVEALTARAVQLQKAIDDERAKRAASVERRCTLELQSALREALRDAGCFKVEVVAPLLAESGRFRLNDEGALVPVDPGDLSTDFLMAKIREVELPEFFRGVRATASARRADAPAHSLWNERRAELGALR